MKFIIALCVGATLAALPVFASADDKHSITASAIVGPQLFEREFSPPATETIVDSVTFSEQLGFQYQWTKLLQPSLAVQTNHNVSKEVEEPSRFTSFQIQPGIAISIGKPFSVGFDAVFASRVGGENHFGFGIQPRLGLNAKLAGPISFVAQVQAPLMIIPSASIALTPFVGLGYELYGG